MYMRRRLYLTDLSTQTKSPLLRVFTAFPTLAVYHLAAPLQAIQTSESLTPFEIVLSRLSLIILLPLTKRISQSTTHNVRNTQTNSRTPHQTSCTEFLAKSLLPPSRQNQVRSTPRGCKASAVGFKAVDVEV